MSQTIESRLPLATKIPLPVTPNKSRELAKQRTTPSPSLKERRGRKPCLANGNFRPLSVFTKSLLVPFDLNTDKALDVLKSDSPERIEEAKKALTPEIKEILEVTEREIESTAESPSRLSDTSQTTTLVGGMGGETTNEDIDMDLMTALQMTSPEQDTMPHITADFSTLCQLPVPEQSQHPAFCTSPFDVKTDLPLLFTATSIDEIRLADLQTSERRGSGTKSAKNSIERKRSFFGLELRTPGSNRSRNAFSISEESPLPTMISTPKSIPTPRTSNTYGSLRGSSPLLDPVMQKDNASSITVRKFSDLFKRKDSMERGMDSPSWSPRNSQDSPNLERNDLEKYLRRTTYTPTYDFDPYSPFPRHPNTGRGWKSRNLKCTTCSDDSCAVCHRVCCAYRAAVLAVEATKDGSSVKARANQQIQEITRLFPYGREAPTFLQCTAGIEGDKAGCGRLVCPDCCSICPDEMCGDTLCRKCKPAMWEECDWHKGDVMVIHAKSIGDNCF